MFQSESLIEPLNADFIVARAVNGQMLDTLGTITATLHLGEDSWQHVLNVLRGSTQAALLGLDFLNVNHALLDYAGHCNSPFVCQRLDSRVLKCLHYH